MHQSLRWFWTGINLRGSGSDWFDNRPVAVDQLFCNSDLLREEMVMVSASVEWIGSLTCQHIMVMDCAVDATDRCQRWTGVESNPGTADVGAAVASLTWPDVEVARNWATNLRTARLCSRVSTRDFSNCSTASLTECPPWRAVLWVAAQGWWIESPLSASCSPWERPWTFWLAHTVDVYQLRKLSTEHLLLDVTMPTRTHMGSHKHEQKRALAFPGKGKMN